MRSILFLKKKKRMQNPTKYCIIYLKRYKKERQDKTMATILDVAKLAGVSQGTVSNVLNGKRNVSSEKIRIVEEAARKLVYNINEQA